MFYLNVVIPSPFGITYGMQPSNLILRSVVCFLSSFWYFYSFGTVIRFLHLGHLPCLPANFSGILILCPQLQ